MQYAEDSPETDLKLWRRKIELCAELVDALRRKRRRMTARAGRRLRPVEIEALRASEAAELAEIARLEAEARALYGAAPDYRGPREAPVEAAA